MASEVKICNEALALIYVQPILTLSANNKAARNCNLIYDTKRDELLRTFPWKFAIKRGTLAPESTTPEFEYDYQFAEPSDSLKILYVGANDGETPYPYSLEKRKILTDYNPIYIKYTERITDPNLFDSMYKAALTAYLAKHLAIPLGAKSEFRRVSDLYDEQISEARFQGSIEETDPEEMKADDWITSRV